MGCFQQNTHIANRFGPACCPRAAIEITASEQAALLLPRESVQTNRNALVREEMNGFTQMSCNLGLQISVLKYLFPWDIPSWWFSFLVFFLFRGWGGGLHVSGLLYIKNQFNSDLRKHFLHLNKMLFVYLQYAIIWGRGGFFVCLFGVFPLPFRQISIDETDHLALSFPS